MFIIEQGNAIFVYDRHERMVYKSGKIKQYKKFNSESLVIITDESVDFVTEVKTKEGHDIVVVNDTKFVSAMIHEDLVFIQRKIYIPILDIYNEHFMNILRLYQGFRGGWVHFGMKFGIPYTSIAPTDLDGKMLYGTKKGVSYACDLETRKITKSNKRKPSKGTNLQDTLNKFRTEVLS